MTAAAEQIRPLSADDLRDAWPALASDERVEGFVLLDPVEAEDFFLSLSTLGQAQIIEGLPKEKRRLWVRLLAPDDMADVLQEIDEPERDGVLALLDEPTRREVSALLAYAEDDAGGLMSPRFARLRPNMTTDEAIRYLRRQSRGTVETIYYVYVLDHDQHLLGAVSFRELFQAPSDAIVRDLMRPREKLLTVPEDMDQEQVARLFAQHDLLALPVVDADDRMKGIVTIDDIVDVVQEEATEDVQKYGGMEALDTPYLQTPFFSMIEKRAGWLSILFIGEMFTASAMGHFEHEIARAVVLALFVPLIISSGGNSGSQASTLVIRAMALGEVKLRDWWRIIQHELAAGLVLGLILGTIGFLRILAWEGLFNTYGEHYMLIAFTVALSLVGVVTWGTLSGSMLPFILRKLGFDPASASAPFVATLVDVSGLIIYFSVADLLLSGTLL
ncbi:MAG: magnesium transporter [Myxococcales bacterium]|nr:magnesium transporter [Myxococcales bacterium]